MEYDNLIELVTMMVVKLFLMYYTKTCSTGNVSSTINKYTLTRPTNDLSITNAFKMAFALLVKHEKVQSVLQILMVETAMHHVGAALTKEELNDKTSLIMQQRDTLETKLNDVQCSLHRSMV